VTRRTALVRALVLGGLLLSLPTAAPALEAEATYGRVRFDADWPEGITYEVRGRYPEEDLWGPLQPFQEVYLVGRIGARLDLDGAAFVADRSLGDFSDGVKVRRARFYLLGDFRLGLPLGYKFEFSIEGNSVFLNDFYLRWKPPKWIDAVDVGYLTPPFGLDNVVSSRSLTFMEVGSPIAALAPGYRSGFSLSGHWQPWRFAWSGGAYSLGQEQISGDASESSAQLTARLAWLPWRRARESGDRFVHLGLGTSYVFSGGDRIRYRARPESFIAPFVVDTQDISAESAVLYGLELAWVDGPLSLQSEWIQSFVSDSDGPERDFGGVYGMVSWFATGEQRPYDGRTGMFERVVPRESFALHGPGWGAWEIGQRISYLDLTDGSVRGGRMLSLTSGITWHLNAQLKLAANYVFAHVTDKPGAGDANVFQARIEIGI